MKKYLLFLFTSVINLWVMGQSLSEGFESASPVPPTGWLVTYANPSPPSGNLVTHTTTYYYAGARSFRFSSYSSGSPYDQYLITPRLNVMTGDQTFSFYYRRYTSGSETFRVGWSSTGTATGDFTWTSDITDATTTWKQYIKTDLPVGTKYVAIHYKSNYAYYLYVDQVVGPTLYVGPPNCATNVSPANSATNVLLSATLNWASGGGGPTGYKLYYGTDNPPTNIVNGTNLGNVLTYDPDPNMLYSTTYYWKIVPTNASGDATGCSVWSFTTGPDPTITTFPYTESFDGATFAPYGWTNTKTAGTSNPGIWNRVTAGTSPTCTPHSGAGMARFNCFSIYIGGTADLVTPPINFPADGYIVKFWMYRDDGYSGNADRVNVYYSRDPSASGGTLLGTINRYKGSAPVVSSNGWYQYSFTMPGGSGGNGRYVIFEGVSAYGNNIFMDDVSLVAPCITPAAQPTALVLTPDFTSLAGSFTAAVSVDNYLVIRSQNPTLSANPVDGTTYTVGSALGGGVVDYFGTGTSFNSPTLPPATLYYYFVFSANDASCGGGPLYNVVNPLTNSTSTLSPGSITSATSGPWSVGATWVGGVAPTATDNAIIADGHAVTIDAATNTCMSLTIQGGGTLDVTGTTNKLTVNHNLTNSGTLDLYNAGGTAYANLTFAGAYNSTFSGTGAVTDLFTLTVNKGTGNITTSSPVLEVMPDNLTSHNTASSTSVADGFLYTGTFNGLVKFSGNFMLTNPLFITTSYSIPATGGLWLNNANMEVAGLNGSPTMSGLLRVSNGTLNIGTTTGNQMGGAATSLFIFEGGVTNIASRLYVTSACNLSVTGGTINVTTVGNATSSSPGFGFTAAANVTMSGGTINLVQRNTGATPIDYNVFGGDWNITGGTLMIGTASTTTNFDFYLRGLAPGVVVDNTINGKTAKLSNDLWIYGNTLINTGSTLNFNGWYAGVMGSTVTNDGTLTGNTASSVLYFNGNGAQQYTGTGIVTPGLQGIYIENFGAGVTFNAPVNALAFAMFEGNAYGMGNVTIGNGTAASAFQYGYDGSIVPAGNLDAAPVFNIGSGTYSLYYADESVARTTGLEIPSGRSVSNVVVNNVNGVTLSGGDLTIGTSAAGLLTLTDGIFHTGTNTVTLPFTGTSISGGSATSFVDGKLTRSFAASRSAVGTYSTATLFPIGKGTTYLPLWMDPTTNSGGSVTFTGEAFTTNSGTLGAGVLSLSANRWESLITAGGANLVSTHIGFGDPAITSTDKFVQSDAPSGVYNSVSTVANYAAGTPNTLKSSGAQIPQSNYYGYFAYGSLTPCSAPVDQPTAFVTSSMTSSSFTGSFTAAASTPSNYLVVRYASGGTPTNPVNYTVYAVGNALGTGTIRSVSSMTSFNETGLTAGATYDYYIYSYNNSGCYGPVYNLISPLLQPVTTCAVATGVPGTPVSSEAKTDRFTLNWTASSTAGVTYELEVATNPAFTTFVPGYPLIGLSVLTYDVTGLTPNTTYYVRLRALLDGCYSQYTSTLTVKTPCLPFTTFPYVESFSETLGCWSYGEGVAGATYHWETATNDAAHGVIAAQSGSHFAKLNVYNAQTGYNPYNLISPSFTLDATPKQVKYHYWLGSSGYTTTPVPMTLQISTNEGKNWTNLYEHTAANSVFSSTSSTSGWTQNVVSLLSYAGQSVMFRYVSNSNYGVSFCNQGIDEFIIEDMPFDPTLIFNPTNLNLGYSPIFVPSPEQTYSIQGIYLNGTPVVVTAPTNFEISTSSGSGFGPSVTIPYSGATLPPVTIYVRFVPTASNTSYSGNITNTGGGASGNVAVTGNSTIYSQYCLSNATYTSDEEIFNVTLGTLNNSSTCATTGGPGSILNEYSNYTLSVSVPNLAQGTPVPFSVQVGTCGDDYNNAVKIYIDFNQNGLLTDPGEEVYVSPASTDGPHLETGSILIPITAQLGVTLMRVVNKETTDPTSITPCGTYSWGETEDYLVNIFPQPMIYVSSATTNNTANVTAGSTTQMIVGLQVETSGAISPFSMTSITANATGTTLLTDISNVKVFYTGSSAVFAPVNQFGSTVPLPAFTDFTFTGSQVMLPGLNYFWITYDINPAATDGNLAAALIPGFVVGGTPQVPTPGVPGARTIVQPLSGTVTVGTGGTYPTLTNAGGLFEAINNKGLSGDLFANIVSDISTEDGTNALNQWLEAGTGNYTVQIQPGSATLKTISGTFAGGLFRLFGADRVTFNGNYGDGGPFLSFVNNSTSTTSAVFWLGSSTLNGATNNTIMNCLISGNAPGTTLYGIVSSSGGTMGGTPDFANSNNFYGYNNISTCQYGIAVYGPTSNDQDLTITGNEIGSTIEGSKLGSTGIYLSRQQNAAVSLNTIAGIISSTSAVPNGIKIANTANTILISRNTISDVKNTSTSGYSSIGIALNSTSTASNISVVNNLIFDIAAYGFSSTTTDNGYGINILTGGGYKIWFNSINLATDQTNAAGKPACLIIASSSTIPAGGLDIRNNIFSIPATVGAERYVVISNAANTKFASINYNDYFTSGPNLGYIGGSNRSNLAAWQTGTGQDANSISVDPAFVSATDLHTAVPAINSAGIAITGVSNDYANMVRMNPPDIGAYEFNLPISTINTLAATNVNQTTADVHGDINTNGEQVNLFFEYGTTTSYGNTTAAVPVFIRSLSSITFDKALSGILPNTLYHYRAKGVSTTSAEVIYGIDMTFTTLEMPTIQGPNPVCEGAVSNVYTTESGKYDYAWTVEGGTITAGGTLIDNTVTVTWPSAGTHTVTVNYRSTPTGPFAPAPTVLNVIVQPLLPVSVSIEASANPVCTGAPVTFTATPVNGGTTPAYQWKVNGLDAGVNSPTYTYSPLNNDVVSCILTSSDLCNTGNPATSNAITMTVNLPSLPVSVTITPSQNDVCLGTMVTFTAVPVNGGPSPSYEWKVNNVTVGGNSPTFAYTPANLDEVICILTSSDYCGTGSPATSNMVIMAVNNPLPVSVSINAGINPVCIGIPVTFTATPVNGGSAPVYQWKVNGANAGTNNPVFSYTPVDGDVVKCMMTSDLTCVTGNPATSNEVIMVVNPLLPVSVSIEASANDVCATTMVTFTATPVNGGQTPSFQWKVNGTNAGTNNALFTYAPVNGDVVSCVLTSSEVCTTGNPATSNLVAMIVNPLNPVSVTIQETANYICAGSVILYIATPVNEGTSPIYQWKVNGNNVGTNSPYYDYAPQNGDVVTCVLTSDISCPSGNPATSNPIVMTVYPNLAVSVTIAPSANPVCQGNSVTFTATPVNGGINPQYQWKVNGIIAGTNTPTYTYTPANNDVVTCVLNSSIDCYEENPVTSNPVTMTVNPLLPVSLTIAASANPVCPGIPVTFTATPVNPGAAPVYQWKVDGVNAGINNPVYTYIPSDGQLVSCELTSSEVCISGNPATSNLITVMISPLPVPVIGGPSTVVAGATGSVYTTLAGQLNYVWTISAGGVITAGGTGTDNTATVTWNVTGPQWIAVNYTDALTGCTGATATQYAVTVLPAPFITVTSPNGGESWYLGSTQSITWDDNITEDVLIELYKGGVYLQQIVAATPSTGSYSWTIPPDQLPGSDYTVKVISTTDPSVFDISDAVFTILGGVPVTLVVQNETVTSGQVKCYNAIQTITVAGGSSTFIVQSGGSATFIAGQNILFMPGTKVEGGGYLHGYITLTSQYCGSLPPAMVAVGTGEPLTGMETTLFRIYPNPTTGRFTLEQVGDQVYENMRVEVYDMIGSRILTETLIGEKRHEFVISDVPIGIYMVRIFAGDRIETFKLIKN